MRTNITDPGAGNLKYEIRKIVEDTSLPVYRLVVQLSHPF
jgi:hypothetical protein